MFKIEKNVEMPTGNETTYPFAKMEVGDSFFIEGGTPDNRGGIYTCAKSVFGGSGHVKMRKVEGGVRVWRIK